MGPSWCRSLRLLFLAFLLALSVAALPPSPTPPEPSTAADALVVRMCVLGTTHRAGAPPLTLCRAMHLSRRRGGGRRHHHQPVALPPPGRGGEEEIDARYGVAKRLVPTGPNPLHN
jgi:hypothetical protein